MNQFTAKEARLSIKNTKIRVRFAPSPTGGLHIGGVRTILYNYLFAKANNGTFILRIEDTDSNRYVDGAEEYIYDCLKWFGIKPDESPIDGGKFAPYRQSERKDIYAQYAQKLIDDGYAYYAFDTHEDIVKMREHDENTKQYDRHTRNQMYNSLSLSYEESEQLRQKGTPYVIRLKMPNEPRNITFNDMIRGEMILSTDVMDDKVLIKADGMPTYHFAVVVDDYLMEISHVFRGEEWLPSAPAHVLLWEYLGWLDKMPLWAHLPLILKPDGFGKFSKRDGIRLGFPVFPITWNDAKSKESSLGYCENGFLSSAVINFLVMLGWSSGTEQEIFSMDELIQKFSMEHVHHTGAKFDYEKAKWYNQQHIRLMSNSELVNYVRPFIEVHGVTPTSEKLEQVINAIKDRCHLLTDFWTHGNFFFKTPTTIDLETLKHNWTDAKQSFFNKWIIQLENINNNQQEIEISFIEFAKQNNLKKKDILLPLRIMLVGGKFGPDVFLIASIIGIEEIILRIKNTLLLI